MIEPDVEFVTNIHNVENCPCNPAKHWSSMWEELKVSCNKACQFFHRPMSQSSRSSSPLERRFVV